MSCRTKSMSEPCNEIRPVGSIYSWDNPIPSIRNSAEIQTLQFISTAIQIYQIPVPTDIQGFQPTARAFQRVEFGIFTNIQGFQTVLFDKTISAHKFFQFQIMRHIQTRQTVFRAHQLFQQGITSHIQRFQRAIKCTMQNSQLRIPIRFQCHQSFNMHRNSISTELWLTSKD